MADSIDDIVQEPVQTRGDLSESPLEKNVNETVGEKPSLFKRIIKDTFKFLPFLGLNYYISAAFLGAGPAIFLTPLGLTIGRAISNWKKGKKSTYDEISGVAKVGVWGATAGLAAYTIPDYIFGAPVSLVGKIAKTLFFNPLLLLPWMLGYRTATYMTDKHGSKDVFRSFFNFKIFKYLKEAYDNDLKKKYLPSVGEAFLTLSPIHFLTLNYLQNPVARLAVGTGNDVLISMISGEEGLLKTAKKKFSPVYQKIKSYVPKLGYQPQYYTPKHA